MADREGMDVKCHKCGAEPGEVCRTPKGRVHKYGAHDGRGRQTTDRTALYYTPDQVKDLIAAAIKHEREACAKVCDALAEDEAAGMRHQAGCDACSDAIRARLDA